MADQLYLSYSIRGFSEQNMLKHFERVLKLFPFSRLSEYGAVLRITAVEFAEPVLFEKAYPSPIPIDTVIAAAAEFQHADCAYQVEAFWDLWQFDEDWKLKPSKVSLFCFGPEFEAEAGENLRIDFGVDANFLPQPGLPQSYRMAQSNIKSLLHLVHEFDKAEAVESRRLWTESGENFAERLQTALEG